MPSKKDPYSSATGKAIRLFAKLLFTKKSYSLSELARFLDVSKQTILRLIDEIERAYCLKIESFIKDRQKYYRLVQTKWDEPPLPLSPDEFALLGLCRAFAANLLGNDFIDETAVTMDKMSILAGDTTVKPFGAAGCFLPGTIDYNGKGEILKTLIKAADLRRCCEMVYRGLGDHEDRVCLIAPLKLFAKRDTIYLHAMKKDDAGEEYRLFAVHRIKAASLTGEKFTPPANYDFDEIFNQSFGVMKREPFRVRARLTGKPAFYVAERNLSQDQKIIWLDDKTLEITFTSSSEDEVVSWALAFGRDAVVIEPEAVRERIRQEIEGAAQNYRL